MQDFEKENEEKKRLKTFFYIKEQLSIFIEFIKLFENKRVTNMQREKKEILSFLYAIVKDIEYVLEKDIHVQELEPRNSEL